MSTTNEAEDKAHAELTEDLKASESIEPMLQFFGFIHLPFHLRRVSAVFAEFALNIVTTAPRNPERTAGLRKLLEAKDCTIRALIYREPERKH